MDADDLPPFDLAPDADMIDGTADEDDEIPIRALEYEPPAPVRAMEPEPITLPARDTEEPKPKRKRPYRPPTTELLNEIMPGNGYDSQELKEVASRIKSKLEEFNVRGSVVQINPGPVVTTFEFKPEAGVK